MDKRNPVVVVASFPRTSTSRSASIIRDDRKPRDMRFEVVYEKRERGERGERLVGWTFFASRKEADSFVSEVR